MEHDIFFHYTDGAKAEVSELRVEYRRYDEAPVTCRFLRGRNHER